MTISLVLRYLIMTLQLDQTSARIASPNTNSAIFQVMSMNYISKLIYSMRRLQRCIKHQDIFTNGEDILLSITFLSQCRHVTVSGKCPGKWRTDVRAKKHWHRLILRLIMLVKVKLVWRAKSFAIFSIMNVWHPSISSNVVFRHELPRVVYQYI